MACPCPSHDSPKGKKQHFYWSFWSPIIREDFLKYILQRELHLPQIGALHDAGFSPELAGCDSRPFNQRSEFRPHDFRMDSRLPTAECSKTAIGGCDHVL